MWNLSPWEAISGRRMVSLRLHSEFEAHLGYAVRLSQKPKRKKEKSSVVDNCILQL
jgi:hypothetical protein